MLRAGGDPDRATARLYICELRQDAASGHSTQAFGVYQDEYRRVDGGWWFAGRDYQSLARSGRGEVFAFPADAFPAVTPAADTTRLRISQHGRRPDEHDNATAGPVTREHCCGCMISVAARPRICEGARPFTRGSQEAG